MSGGKGQGNRDCQNEPCNMVKQLTDTVNGELRTGLALIDSCITEVSRTSLLLNEADKILNDISSDIPTEKPVPCSSNRNTTIKKN